MLTLLDRTLLKETALLTGFFSLAYLGLISLVIVAPLIDAGARLSDVLLLLPLQLGFPATIVLPLAFVTAIIASFGRMREDGEMIALQASGISQSRLPKGLLPLVFLMTILVAWLAHTSMPRAYRAYREGRANLVRQAIATKVAREKPIIQQDGLKMTALDAADNQVSDLFAWHSDKQGDRLLTYAPKATWVAAEDGSGQSSMRLQLEQTRQIRISSSSSGSQRLTTMSFPLLVIDLPDKSEVFLQKAEGKETAELMSDLPRLKQMHQAISSSVGNTNFLELILSFVPVQFTTEHIQDWSRLHALCSKQETPLFDHLPQPLPGVEETEGREALLHALNQAITPALRESYTSTNNLNAHAIGFLRNHGLGESNTPQRASLLVAWDTLQGAVSFDGPYWTVMQMVKKMTYLQHRKASSDKKRTELTKTITKEWRVHQMAWHLRLVLSFSIMSLWVFGSGLGLSYGGRNRMYAACIGIGVVLVALLPGIGIVKGMRGKMPINPAWILWAPQIILIVIGSFLWWRRAR